MADLVSYCNADRDIEQALISLKKGAQLLKYGRKGKPKFYPFRVSNDETSLIWIANSGQKNLKLASVSRIIPGQRTAVFQRYLRPEKDYLSFSLIYNKGKRSLDLICKDKVEAEIWIAGLKSLISSGQDGRSKIDGWNGGLSFDESRDLTSISGSTSSASAATLEISSPEVFIISSNEHNPEPSDDVASEQTNNIMQQPKPPVSDPLRFSVSSVPTSTSSSHDEPDSLGDVYVWGEVPCEGNIVLPKPLDCNIVIDVARVACGARQAALLTRQGEVFTWGEEDIVQPRLVDSLTCLHIDFVACGDYNTCAVNSSGELYTWAHNAGLPKRVTGPLEGLQVTSVACGPWHTALVTSSGRLFTFGEGSFGVLGHGDRTSVLIPKEVESLSGLRTVKVACGVWHTAAIVEIIAAQSETKLFTWGDGDKNRLGQGDREARLKPTCVSSLIDHNFQKLACGHSLTVGLTVSGRVFAMGSSVYGQLGNVNSDGKLPCEVEGELTVEEISCGAYHVAVLTSRNEVYTWGKGANGSLGHGDNEDRKVPTLVEALKGKNVKFVSCGPNYTAAVCVHKWVSGAEQMQCSTCRNAFGFTRKKHHCYNCGLVHCHTCSSKKAVRAALAPNQSKPYRVCDSCSAKLSGAHGRRNSVVFARSALPSTSNLDVVVRQLPSKAKKANRSVTKNVGSRPASPFSRKSSPPRSSTPVPTASGLSVSQNVTDSLRKTNELLNDELLKLREQVRELKLQESELQKSAKRAEEAVALAGEESAKYNTAKEVIRSLTEQLKDMAEKLPPGSYDPDSVKLVHLINGAHDPVVYDDTNLKSEAINGFDLTSHSGISPDASADNGNIVNVSSSLEHNVTQIKSEWIEQYEPGVYITLVALQDGTRDLKRVRFSRRRFGEHQAEKWWSENRERVYEKYNVRGSSVSGQAAAQKTEDGFSPSLL